MINIKKIVADLLEWAIYLVVLFIVVNGINDGQLGWIVAAIVYFQVIRKIKALEESQHEINNMVKGLWAAHTKKIYE